MTPFFLLSSGRSGSTLLASMLNMHSALHVPVELIGLYSWLPGRLPLYGDLRKTFNRRLLARDLAAVGQLRQFDVAFDPEQLAEDLRDCRSDLHCIIAAFYGYLLRESGKQVLCDKTPNNMPHLSRIVRTFPQAKIIHLVRDGRDVALSSMQSREGLNFRNTFELGLFWRRGNTRLADFGHRNADRYHRLRYEDLVEAPERELRDICRFMDQPFESAMLVPTESGFARENAARLGHHQNLGRPLMKDNVAKWRNTMDVRDLQLYQTLAGPALRRFGYGIEWPESPPGWRARAVRLAVATVGRATARSLRRALVHGRWLWATLLKRLFRVDQLRAIASGARRG